MLYLGLGDTTLRITDFEWDDANIEHIGRHRVSPDKAEQVLQNRPVVRRSRSGRYVAIGQTDEGRYLVVVFEVRRAGRARVVTARPAQSEERRLYRRERS